MNSKKLTKNNLLEKLLPDKPTMASIRHHWPFYWSRAPLGHNYFNFPGLSLVWDGFVGVISAILFFYIVTGIDWLQSSSLLWEDLAIILALICGWLFFGFRIVRFVFLCNFLVAGHKLKDILEVHNIKVGPYESTGYDWIMPITIILLFLFVIVLT